MHKCAFAISYRENASVLLFSFNTSYIESRTVGSDGVFLSCSFVFQFHSLISSLRGHLDKLARNIRVCCARSTANPRMSGKRGNCVTRAVLTLFPKNVFTTVALRKLGSFDVTFNV